MQLDYVARRLRYWDYVSKSLDPKPKSKYIAKQSLHKIVSRVECRAAEQAEKISDAKLRAAGNALRKFGMHSGGCVVMRKDAPCNCGFSKAIEMLGAQGLTLKEAPSIKTKSDLHKADIVQRPLELGGEFSAECSCGWGGSWFSKLGLARMSRSEHLEDFRD